MRARIFDTGKGPIHHAAHRYDITVTPPSSTTPILLVASSISRPSTQGRERVHRVGDSEVFRMTKVSVTCRDAPVEVSARETVSTLKRTATTLSTSSSRTPRLTSSPHSPSPSPHVRLSDALLCTRVANRARARSRACPPPPVLSMHLLPGPHPPGRLPLPHLYPLHVLRITPRDLRRLLHRMPHRPRAARALPEARLPV